MAEGIPTHVEILLRDCVTSFEVLQVLLVLKSNREIWWSVDMLVKAIRAPAEQVKEAGQSLRVCRLASVRRVGSLSEYRYSPETEDLGRSTDDLARCFVEQTPLVMRLMNAQAIERMRSSAMRAFAHAFVIKRKEDADG